MIQHINHCKFVGVLIADVPPMETKEQEPMAILKLATDFRYMDGTELKVKSKRVTIFLFGELAVSAHQYKKGMIVDVSAEIEEKETLDGDKKSYKTLVTGKNLFILDIGSRNRPSQDVPDAEEIPF